MTQESGDAANMHDTIDDEENEAALVKAQLAGLANDFRQLATAEIEYLKLRMSYSGQVAKWIGIYSGLAIFAGLCTLIALVLGLLLIISVYLGPVWATIIVTLVFASTALLAASLAKARARDLTFGEGMDDE